MTLHFETKQTALGRSQNRPRSKVKLGYVAAHDPLPVVSMWPRGVRLAIIVGASLTGWSLIISAIVIPGAFLPVAAIICACLSALCFALALARQRRG